MKKNIGGLDRTIRIVLSVGLLLLGLIFQTWWGIVGIIPLVTAFINFCPLYLPFSISTYKNKK